MCLGMKEPEKTTWKMLKLAGGSCWGTRTKEHWEERWGSHFPAQQKGFFFCCIGSPRPHSPSTYLHTVGTHPASARGQPGTWQHPVCTPHMPASPTACRQGWGWSCALSPARHPEHPITSCPKPALGRGAAGWAASLLPLPRGDIGAPLRHPKSPGSLTPSSHHPSGG